MTKLNLSTLADDLQYNLDQLVVYAADLEETNEQLADELNRLADQLVEAEATIQQLEENLGGC